MGFVADIETGLYVIAAEIFLYGIYLALFGFYIHVLHSRGMPNHRWLTVATILLFILCTVHCALQLASTTLDNRAMIKASSPDLLSGKVNTARVYVNRAANGVYVTSNVVADSIFILRCYAIWNFRRTIIIVPTLLTFAVAGLGYFNVFNSLGNPENWIPAFRVGTFLFDESVGVSVITTFILMGLTAGRIWWIVRVAHPIIGRKTTSRYYGVCAMILESGSLYCAGGIAFVIISISTGTVYTTTGAVMGQLVGIAPTMIAVRVGLGRSIDNVESFVARTRVGASLKFTPALAALSPEIIDCDEGNGDIKGATV
ncbi:hypothetical protein FB451DRAFT_1264343 [Mycena latifolia]|nr:hypothetical protein FB451DRAFT_1264343 [Mycena latifolia]